LLLFYKFAKEVCVTSACNERVFFTEIAPKLLLICFTIHKKNLHNYLKIQLPKILTR